MPKLDFYFDNKKVNEDILNWRDLEIEVSFEDETGVGTIKTGSLEFTGALADKIHNWNAQGLVGGPGIFEAPPFRIEVCGSGEQVFDGGINIADCTAAYECDKITAPLRANTIDFLNDRASSFSFAYLASLPDGSPGKLTQSNYVSVPYVINSVPDYVNVMVAGISLYVLLKELKEVLEKTVALASELGGDVSIVAGLVAIPPVGILFAIGRVLVDIVRITLYILYLIFMIQAIIALMRIVFDNLIQPVKYKKGMRVIDLFRAGAAHLGMGFSSPLLESVAHKNDVIIPRKIAFDSDAPKHANAVLVQTLFGTQTIKHKDYDDAHNPTSTGYFEGTLADLILAEEARLNCELRVIGNTMYLAQKETMSFKSNYTLPDLKRKDPHGTNACELVSNYLIKYQLDDQDTNTYDQYTGTSCQMILSPNVVSNKKNILLKNLTEVDLIYALAKRKEKLNGVEQVASFIYEVVAEIYTAITGFINEILKVINGVLSAIAWATGGTPPQIGLISPFPPNPFLLRVGMMLLSSDFIGVPKIMVIDSTNKLHSNNATLTAARTLMDELHFTNFAVRKVLSDETTIKDDHNQWLTYADKEVPFCCGDYNSLLNNNYIKTFDQKQAKVKSIVWNPTKGTARLTYRVKEQYTKNLNQRYVIDGKP